MPAALAVDWPAVRTLAVAVGLAEAARRMGIDGAAVRQRAHREGWADDPQVAAVMRRSAAESASAAAVTAGVTLSRPVTSAPQALACAMLDDSVQTRASLLRTARRAAARAERCDDDELMLPEIAGVIHQHAKTASLAGGWAAQQAGAVNVNLRLAVTAQAEAPEMPTYEAEVTGDEGVVGT